MAETLRELRRKRGYTQQDLTDKVNKKFGEASISRNYYAQLETGDKKNPSVAKVKMIAEVLRVTPQEIYRLLINRSQ